jgi:uncharacterized phage protein gp47/JayE
MALTNEGLVIRRFPEVQEAIQAAVLQNVSTEVIFDEDTLMAQLINIVAAEIASLEEVVQSVYDSLDRDKSEGTSLDSLLNLIGLQRIGESFTSGPELVIGDDGTTIPKGTIFSNPSTNDRFETTVVGNLLQSSCLSCDYQVGTVSDSTLYTVSVNGGDYNYTSGTGATAESIIYGLTDALNEPADRSWQAAELVSPLRLRVRALTETKISLSVLSALLPESVTDNVQIQALNAGAIKAPSLSVTQVITAVGGITSVTNLEALGVGRQRETDEDFRLRSSQSLSLSGSATIPALTAALLNIQDVSSAIVVENVSGVTVNGRPPKSFECIVTAPDTTAINTEIANTIWGDKPAGIELVGNTAVTIVDSTNTQRVINFSRPLEVVIATRVTYSLYDEEVFPDNGASFIKAAVVNYGNLLTAGEDVIPKRFYGSIYSSVEGISDLVVECQTLTTQGDTPVEGSWSEAKISIAGSNITTFNEGDTYSVEV